MRHGSLFSGIGGFDLAAEWMGWENVFHCEWNPFGQKILKHYWPNAKSYGDITKTDFTEWKGKVDIVSGGFPCQPYSTAGKRKGKADDRHLWPEMLRAIREIQPRWVVGENVPGLLNWQRGMVLDEIKADLEATGFEVFPSLVLPACGKNAPHRRDRLWIVAYSINNRYKAGREQETEKNGVQGISRKTMDTGKFNGANLSSITTNPNISSKSEIGRNNGKVCRLQDEKRRSKNSPALFGGNGIENLRNDANTNNQRSQGGQDNRIIGESRTERNKQFTGLFQPEWEIFPTQSPLCGGNDGIPNRVDRIKALGNAIVPQVAYEIFKAIEEFEKCTSQ